MRCLVWTVDRPRPMKRALRMGVDGIITNRPEVLRTLLRTHQAAGRPIDDAWQDPAAV
jgi:glycerophosphoryl diester phosphodiesterase